MARARAPGAARRRQGQAMLSEESEIETEPEGKAARRGFLRQALRYKSRGDLD